MAGKILKEVAAWSLVVGVGAVGANFHHEAAVAHGRQDSSAIEKAVDVIDNNTEAAFNWSAHEVKNKNDKPINTLYVTFGDLALLGSLLIHVGNKKYL